MSELRKEVKEIYKYPLLFDMHRLEFLKKLMRLEMEVDKKGWIKESKEVRELIKYRLMDTRYIFSELGFDGGELEDKPFGGDTGKDADFKGEPPEGVRELDDYFSEVTDINETNE